MTARQRSNPADLDASRRRGSDVLSGRGRGSAPRRHPVERSGLDQGLTARHDTEVWAGAIIDWLEQNASEFNVDPDRIDIVGWPLGGYYAPRTGVREASEARRRVGANHNWSEVQEERRQREAVNSPKRELRLFDELEGGTEHISIDNMPYVGGVIADWVAETFAEGV